MGGGPVAQGTDRLETLAGTPLISLYSTELRSPAVADGSETAFEMERSIESLPCPHERYRFISSRAALNSSEFSTYSATVKMLKVELPPGFRCGVALPSYTVAGEVEVMLKPVGRVAIAPTRYTGDSTSVESSRGCMTLAGLCSGDYEMSAVFKGFGHVARAAFVFQIKTSDKQETVESPTVVEQCRMI